MNKWKYWVINLIVYIVFVVFYFYPGLTTGKWVASVLGDISPSIIIILVLVFQCILAFSIYSYKAIIIKYLNRIKKTVASTKFWYILFAIAFILFFGLAVKRHINLDTALFDFALEEQVVWNTSQGRILQGGVEVSNYLGDHVSILTILPSILYSFLPSPFLLIFIQIACVMSAAFAIKKISDRELHNSLISLSVFFIYIFYIGLTGLLLGDYRAVVLSMPFLAWGIYLIENPNKKTLGVVLLVLVALAKEDIAIFVGTLGLYQFIIQKKKIGALLALWGYGFALIGVFLIIPYFREGPSDTLYRYGDFLSIFQMADVKISYIIRLFFPLLFLPILSWKTIWVMLPNLFINLFSIYLGQLSALNQYDIATGLIIFWSFIQINKNKEIVRERYYWFAILFITNILLLSGHSIRRHFLSGFNRYNDYLYIQELKEKIPTDAVVSATNMVGGQFGQRENLQLFNEGIVEYEVPADYIVIDKISDWSDDVEDLMNKRLNEGYIIREENESFIVLQKIYFSY